MSLVWTRRRLVAQSRGNGREAGPAAAAAAVGPGAAVAASHLTTAALEKAARIRHRSFQYEHATDLSFSYDDDEVRATVQVSVHASAAVCLRRASPGTEPEVECACRQPQDRGMPCKHVIGVFHALQQQEAIQDRSWDRLDACWFADVWHTSTWRLQNKLRLLLICCGCASPLDRRSSTGLRAIIRHSSYAACHVCFAQVPETKSSPVLVVPPERIPRRDGQRSGELGQARDRRGEC